MKAKLIKSFVTVALLGLAIWAAVSLYHRYLQNPWTRDGQVRANVVGIAPRVSGPIIRVGVRDNQPVHQGDLLFEIDPADFQAQVDVAAGQVQTAEANLTQQTQNLQRQTELYRTRVNALQDLQNAQDSFLAAQAQLASAKANLELAKLNLSYTKVVAPVEGYVTNMNTSPGYLRDGGQSADGPGRHELFLDRWLLQRNPVAAHPGRPESTDHADGPGRSTLPSRGSQRGMGHFRGGWRRQHEYGLVARGGSNHRLGAPAAALSGAPAGGGSHADALAHRSNRLSRDHPGV